MFLFEYKLYSVKVFFLKDYIITLVCVLRFYTQTQCTGLRLLTVCKYTTKYTYIYCRAGSTLSLTFLVAVPTVTRRWWHLQTLMSLCVHLFRVMESILQLQTTCSMIIGWIHWFWIRNDCLKSSLLMIIKACVAAAKSSEQYTILYYI